MAKKYVFSTLANDQIYNLFDKKRAAGTVGMPVASVLVKGGAGVAGDWRRLETPRGIGTPVTDEQIALLKQNKTFLIHEANGYVCVEEGEFDANDVAETMAEDDKSRPLTDETIKAASPGVATVATNVEGDKPVAVAPEKKGK